MTDHPSRPRDLPSSAGAAPEAAHGKASYPSEFHVATPTEGSVVVPPGYSVLPIVPRVLIAPSSTHDGIVLASLGKRIGAAAVDLVFSWILLGLTINLFGWGVTQLLLSLFGSARLSGPAGVVVPLTPVVLVFGSLLLVTALTGRSLGRMLVGLRVVKETSYRMPGWNALGRGATLFPAFVFWPYALLLILSISIFDKSERLRGWHDLAGGTVVVDTRAGVDPKYDNGPFEPPVRLA